MNKLTLFISSSSGRLLLRCIAFAVIATATLVLWDRWFSQNVVLSDESTNWSKLHRLLYEHHPDEIAILGASTAMRAFLPDSLGPQFYNYGITATNFQKLEPELTAELTKNKDTPVLIDFHPSMLASRERPNLRAADYRPVAQHPVMETLLKEYDYDHPWYRIPGLRYYGLYLEYVSAWAGRSNQGGKLGSSRGAVYVDRVQSAETMQKKIATRRERPMPVEVDSLLLSRFEALVAAHPNRQIVLVAPPLHAVNYEIAVKLDDYQVVFDRLEHKFPNVTCLLFDGREYPDSHFLDTSHLNLIGAQTFSAALRKELIAKGIINPTTHQV